MFFNTITASAASTILVVALAVSGYGTSRGERAASGGLLGAGAGAAAGALAGDPGTGALIGGAVGAAAGAFTDPCTLNLGDPVWADRRASREDYYRRCGHYPP